MLEVLKDGKRNNKFLSCRLTNFADIDFGVEIDNILEDKLEESLSCKTSNSLLQSNIITISRAICFLF